MCLESGPPHCKQTLINAGPMANEGRTGEGQRAGGGEGGGRAGGGQGPHEGVVRSHMMLHARRL